MSGLAETPREKLFSELHIEVLVTIRSRIVRDRLRHRVLPHAECDVPLRLARHTDKLQLPVGVGRRLQLGLPLSHEPEADRHAHLRVVDRLVRFIGYLEVSSARAQISGDHGRLGISGRYRNEKKQRSTLHAVIITAARSAIDRARTSEATLRP